jgi:putative ABC transport system substrate-binding protein
MLNFATDPLVSLCSGKKRNRLPTAGFSRRDKELGWVEGRNLQIDLRWSGGDVERSPNYAGELVGLAPDALFAYANAELRPFSQATRTIPIVFVGASAPVEDGYVASFARPRGNITVLPSTSRR